MGTSPRRLCPWWVLLLALAIGWVGIRDRDLWRPDEPRDAAIALGMAWDGDYVVPYLAGQPFVEKPPLYFVVASVAVRLGSSILGNAGAIRATSGGGGRAAATAVVVPGMLRLGARAWGRWRCC
jgi:4-amino-4-deoxy-L-arabinose transferase-like glycosyltransferase